jgi:hypothetical protein
MIFAAPAVVVALNIDDQEQRIERCHALGDLLQDGLAVAVFDLDQFVGIVDTSTPALPLLPDALA